MGPRLKEFLLRWAINTIGVLTATRLVKGIHCAQWQDLVVASLLLGILYTFVRPIMMFFSLPLMIFTLGLFTFVINALLLYSVGMLLAPGFQVTSFKAAFWGALVISIVTFFLNILTGTGKSRFTVRRSRPPSNPNPPDSGGGPVIDI